MAAKISIWVTGQPIEPARREFGGFAEMIERSLAGRWHGAYQWVDCENGREPLPGPGEVAGVIVSGSPAHVQDAEPWMERTAAALHAFAGSSTPVLGICFGHQLLGRAFGGGVAPNPRGRELGILPLRVLAADDLLGQPAERSVVMAHFDSIRALPAAAELLATTQLEDLAAIRFAPSVWGVQFHPEMDAAIARHYVEYYGGRWDPQAAAHLGGPGDYAGELMGRFAGLCAAAGA